MPSPTLTKAQRRALRLLREWPEGLSARAFAAAAYPEAFRRTSATGRKGRGTLNGAGASLKAGAFLRRLFRMGLVDASIARSTGLVTYRVAVDGLDALEQDIIAGSRNQQDPAPAEPEGAQPPRGRDPVVDALEPVTRDAVTEA